MADAPCLSVVIATFNRTALLERLLGQLSAQTLSGFEVVVVDDGGREPVQERLQPASYPFALTVHRQKNAGAAAARHQGIERARGPVIVIVDDDMQVGREFLQDHLRLHRGGEMRVVLGRVRPDGGMDMPLHERWHIRMLEQFAERCQAGRPIRGNDVYTGNLSFQRELYLSTGGFDASLRQSEDAELGLRFEKAGAQFVFSEDAFVIHSSDHSDAEKWRARAFRYGLFDRQIWRKHADLLHANPWRYLFEMNVLARPFLFASVLAPSPAGRVAKGLYEVACQLDRAGMERAAFKGATVAYAMEYVRGLRDQNATLGEALKEIAQHGRQRLGGAL